MISAASSMRIYRKREQLENARIELERLDEQHWQPTNTSGVCNPMGACYRQRVTGAKVKHLYMTHKDTIVRGGCICKMLVEKVWNNVYDISFQDPR